MGWLKKQFLREYHNKQDKAKAPDYRDNLTEWPKDDLNNLADNVLAKFDAQRKKYFLQVVRNGLFVLSNLKYRFGWSLTRFATENSLPRNHDSTKESFSTIKNAAESDLKIITEAVRQDNQESITIINRFYFCLVSELRNATLELPNCDYIQLFGHDEPKLSANATKKQI